MGRPKKLVTDTPKPAPEVPNIQVLERRLQHPFGLPSVGITLKTSGWTSRWFNSAILADKIWRAKEGGWVPVKYNELVDPDQAGGTSKSPDGHVVRGDKGSEVLMKMPTEYWHKLQQAKIEANMAAMRPGVTKRSVVEAVGNKFGEEAADFVSRTRLVGDVVDSRERIHADPEASE